MQWTGRRQSTNVTDSRGVSGRGRGAMIGGGGGIVVLIIVLVGYFTGYDTSGLADAVGGMTGGTQYAQPYDTGQPLTEEEQRQLDFVETILADTEDIWGYIFNENGWTYTAPQLVLYNDYIDTPYGGADAAMGPFYLSENQTVYLDMSFFSDLRNNYGARIKNDVAGNSGDFVVAYVIAHEVGHHVQYELGTLDNVHNEMSGLSSADANELSVGLELQADFYAGVFAYYEGQTNGAIESGDIDSAILAAEAIGDDTLQKRANGRVVPDSFTHGTSEQRAYWFKHGYETGDIYQGDTFKALGLQAA